MKYSTDWLQQDKILPSFTYNGEQVSLSDWSKSFHKTDDGKTQIEYLSPDAALTVRLTVTVYQNYPVIEVVPELICTGDQNTGMIDEFKSCTLTLPAPDAESTLRAVHGSSCFHGDFTAREFRLMSHCEDHYKVFTCGEGRSSSAWMPWFGLDMTPLSGLEIAIGWTGAWKAEFRHNGETVDVAIGMEDSHFYMKPGEKFRLCSFLLFCREGTGVSDFQSVIRSFMIAHKSPRDSQGKIMKPKMPLTGSGGNRSSEFLQNIVRYFAKHDFKCFDTYWIDAGWNGEPHEPDPTTNCGDCWNRYLGNWHVNPLRHPGGLKDVADVAHENGMQFLLWFEAESATTGKVPILEEHPEWFNLEGHRSLLDLGNEDARNWILSEVCRNIDEIGIDIYRQDFNMDPLPVWRQMDEEDRKGVSEIRHIMGLYQYWDALRERYPDMLLENCASGGRRLDYEMVSRSHAYCRSDYYIGRSVNDPENRYHRYQILMGQNELFNTFAYVPFQ